MQKKPSIGFQIVYVVCRVYFFLGRLTPLRLWVFIGRMFGQFLYLIDYPHRKIALANLRFAFGTEKTEQELGVIIRNMFMEFGMISHEWCRLKYIKKEELPDLLEVEGIENLRAAKQKGRAVILLGAHFGNFEYANLFYASTISRVDFIVRAIDNPFLEAERLKCDAAFGVRILYKQNGLRPAIKNLKNGEDLIIFADQKVNLSEGILCKFFGKTTATIPLVPALAQKYGAPIVPMFIVRCKDPIHHKIICLPELKLDPNDGEQMITRATQRQNDIIEAMIRRYPQQWLWFHRKWSYHYPEIYREKRLGCRLRG
jgi:KDO2-lipid IV(A) lauroyltransferase